MIKLACRLLIITLCVAAPATILYPQQDAQKKDNPAAKKQGDEEQKKQEDEGKDADTAKKQGGGDITLKEIVVKGEQFLKKSPYTVNVVNSNDIEKKGISRTSDIIKMVPEVCRIFCATANPTEVILAETEQGRGVLGVVDGFRPAGVEGEEDILWRKNLLRQIGYKL